MVRLCLWFSILSHEAKSSPVQDEKMNQQELLQKINKISIWQQGDIRAPHKPLLLLYSLGRAYGEEPRLKPYEETSVPLTELLRQFGPMRKSYKPEEPFTRLPNDGLWELQDDSGNSLGYSPGLAKKFLRENVKGGFPVEIYNQLIADQKLIKKCALAILTRHFPDTYHADILRQVNLPIDLHDDVVEATSVPKRKRSPEFRYNVLRAYERKCAVCGSAVRIGDALFDLEAAHIKWHSHGGPDDVSNGLALCVFHHKAFDRGAFGIEPSRDKYVVKLSEDFNGGGPASEWLRNSHGHELRLPFKQEQMPDSNCVEWHRANVFKGA